MEKNLYGFFGDSVGDVVFHLSLLLAELGKKVLTIDLTGDRSVLSCLGVEEPEWEYHHVIFRNRLFIAEEYDCILIAMDSGTFLPGMGYRDLFVLTSGHRVCFERIAEVLESYEKDAELILRDYVPGSLDVEFFRAVMPGLEKVRLFERIPLDERDYALRRELEYGIAKGLRYYSGSYRRLIGKTAEYCSGVSCKEIKKAIKELERGAKYEYRILEQLPGKWLCHKQSGSHRHLELSDV